MHSRQDRRAAKNTRSTDRTPLSVSTALAVAAVALGCRAHPVGSDRDSTLTVLVPDSELMAMLVYQTSNLMFTPLYSGDSGEAVGRVAESWGLSDDHLTWTVRLRDDVRWHDGVPVTAHDVVFSAELFGNPDLQLPGCGAWMKQSSDSVWAPDDHTLAVTLKSPSLPAPVGRPPGCLVILPRHLLEGLDPADFADWDFWQRPIGNGPYRFVRRVPDTMYEVEANPDFYAGAPRIPRVVVRLGAMNPVIELGAGGADVALFVGPTEVTALRRDPRFRIHHLFEWSQLYAVVWNQTHPLLAEGAVRRALAHAIDRRELAQLLNYPDEMPLVGGLSEPRLEAEPYLRAGWSEGLAFDPALARRLLDQADWIDRDGDGIRDRTGVEARFTLTVISGGDYQGREQGVFIQDQLRRVGVAVDIRPMDFATSRDVFREGRFEAIIYVFENAPEDALIDWLGEPHPRGLRTPSSRGSPFGYRSEELARLLRTLYYELDLDVREDLYHRINAVLERDAPFTFLFPVVEPHITHRRIRGFRPGRYLTGYPEELWIEEEP